MNPPASPNAADRPEQSDSPAHWALALITLCNLAMVWSFPHFISQDGSSHLYNAWVLLHYYDPGFEVFRKTMLIDYSPIPNLASHLILIPLLKIVSPGVAEKLLVSLYLLLWPVSLVYALRSARRHCDWLALLAMPLAMNWFLHMGFYNFCLGIEFYLFALGAWLRTRRTGRPGAAALFGFLLALYFCHLIAFLEWCVAVGVLEGWRLWRMQRRRAKGLPRELGRIAVAFLPALPLLGLSIWFVTRAVPGDPNHPFPLGFDSNRFADLLGPVSGSVAFRHSEDSAAMLLKDIYLAAIFGVLFIPKPRRSRSVVGFGLLLAVFCCLFLFVSNDFGGGNYIAQRFQVFIYPTALLWLAGHRWAPTPRLAVQWAGAGLALVFLLCRIPPYVKLNGQYEEWLRTFDRVPPRATVLPLVLTRYPITASADILAVASYPLLHVASLAGLERGFVDLSNYEADTLNFPLRWRPGMSPKAMGEIGLPNPLPKLAAYPAATGRTLDFVAFWDNGGMESSPTVRESLLKQLDANYRLTTTSEPEEFGRLYQYVGGAPDSENSAK